MIEQVRVSAARRLLGLGREAPKKVAVDCGFAQRRGLLRVKCGSGAKRSSGSAGHPTRDTITAAQNPVKLCTGHSVNLKTGAPMLAASRIAGAQTWPSRPVLQHYCLKRRLAHCLGRTSGARAFGARATPA